MFDEELTFEDQEFLDSLDVEQDEQDKNKAYCSYICINLPCAPISTAIHWHELTNFRHANYVRSWYPEIWDQWKKKGLIPPAVFVEVESQPKTTATNWYNENN